MGSGVCGVPGFAVLSLGGEAMREEGGVGVVECGGLRVTLRVRPVREFNELLARAGAALAKVVGGGGFCQAVRIDEEETFPDVEDLFASFRRLLDEVNESVAKALKRVKGGAAGKAEIVKCVMDAVARGSVEVDRGSVEWDARVDLVEGRRGFARATLTVRYALTLRDVAPTTAHLVFGSPDNEGECLARGCDRKRLSRVVRGVRGGAITVEDGRIHVKVLCLNSCKRAAEDLHNLAMLAGPAMI